MKTFQRLGLIAVAVLLTMLLIACGGQGPAANTANQGANNNNAMNNQNRGNMTGGTPMVTATPMTGATPMGTATPMNNMTGGIPITPNMGGNMAALIHTGKANVDGNTVNLLLTNKDFAVYYYKPDTMFKATCTGQCAQDWPPVLAPQGMMVSSSTTLPKQLSVRQTANGNQVFYDGHALYTYAADTQAANATGRGQDMQWYLVGFLL